MDDCHFVKQASAAPQMTYMLYLHSSVLLRVQIQHFVLSICTRALARVQMLRTKMLYLSRGQTESAGASV
jgi:hypothetical protein